MKALCVQSPHHIVIEERPMPFIAGDDDVLLKVKAGGVCGSDVHVYHGTSTVATYPRVIGHEIAAEVIEKGAGVGVFSLGDRVVIDPVVSCGTCYQCSIGRRNVCSRLRVRSVHLDGGYQEYLVVPQSSIYRIPDHLSWEEAALVEPFTIAEQVCSRGAISENDLVFIMGAGPIGLTVLKMAKLYGATCFISDIVDSKLDFAVQWGANGVINARKSDVKAEITKLTSGTGATVVVDAACIPGSFELALDCVCAAGRVITLGFNKEPSAITQLSITAREIDVRGSRLHNNKFPIVIDHFASGRLSAKDMITHRFDFTRVNDAMRLIEDPAIEKGKVTLLF